MVRKIRNSARGILALTFVIFVVLGVSYALAGESTEVPAGSAPSIEATEVEKGEPFFREADDGPAPRPNHQPFDQIPPMPMPQDTDEPPVSTEPGGKIKEYSAERATIRPDGQVQHIQKLFVAPDKFRMEMSSFMGQGQMIMISRQDKKVIWTLFTEKKVYTERPLHEGRFQQSIHQIGKTVDEEDLGSERIMGYKCRKKRVETTMQLMGHKVTRRTIVWKAEKFDFPLRTQNENGLITELRNIKIGHQQDSLFAIPPGYQKAPTIFQAIGSTGGVGKSKDSGRKEHSKQEAGLLSGSP